MSEHNSFLKTEDEFFYRRDMVESVNQISCQCGGHHEYEKAFYAWNPTFETSPIGYDGLNYAEGEDPYLLYHPGVLECFPADPEVPLTISKELSIDSFLKKKRHDKRHHSSVQKRKNGKNGRGTRSVRKLKHSVV